MARHSLSMLLTRAPPTSMGPQTAPPPPSTLATTVGPLLRAYEEQLLVELAAKLFSEFSQQDGVPRGQIARLLGDYPPSAVQLVFSRYDARNRGVLGARAFLALVRYLNFGHGFCDACFAPIGERERGFACVDCHASGFILCERCFPQRSAFHPPSNGQQQQQLQQHRFIPAEHMDRLQHPEEPPHGVGVFLRAHLKALWAEIDPARQGVVSRDAFRMFQRARGCTESYTDFLLQLDGDETTHVTKRRLLYLTAGQHLLRQCDECGALKFAGSGDVLSCLECVADYDVCADCWLASRCRHEHAHFRVAEPFQLRFAGLHYRYSHADQWTLSIASYELFAPYEPFLRHRIGSFAQVKQFVDSPALRRLGADFVGSPDTARPAASVRTLPRAQPAADGRGDALRHHGREQRRERWRGVHGRRVRRQGQRSSGRDAHVVP